MSEETSEGFESSEPALQSSDEEMDEHGDVESEEEQDHNMEEDGHHNDPPGIDDGAWDTDGGESNNHDGRDLNDSLPPQQFPPGLDAPSTDVRAQTDSDYDTDSSFPQNRPKGLRGGFEPPSDSDASIPQDKPIGYRDGFQSFPSDSESSISQGASRPQGIRGGFEASSQLSPTAPRNSLDVVPDNESKDDGSDSSSSGSRRSESRPTVAEGGDDNNKTAEKKKGRFFGWNWKKDDNSKNNEGGKAEIDTAEENAAKSSTGGGKKRGWFGRNEKEDENYESSPQAEEPPWDPSTNVQAEPSWDHPSANVAEINAPISPNEEGFDKDSQASNESLDSREKRDGIESKNETFEDEPAGSGSESHSSQKDGTRGVWAGNSNEEPDVESVNQVRVDDERLGQDNDSDRSSQKWNTNDLENARPESFRDELDTKSRGTTRSYYSSIQSTRERKVITCLVLCLCLLCLMIAIGLGVGIGYAVGRNDEDTEETVVVKSTVPPVASPPSQAPSQTPSTYSPTSLPTSNPISPPTSSPTLQTSASPTVIATMSPSSVPTGTDAPTTVSASMQPTSIPTGTDAPTSSLLQLIIDNSFDGGRAVQSPGTPQNTAYEWLSENSELNSYSDERKLTRYALATFFYSTNGLTSWDDDIRDDGWVTDASECEWASTANNQCTGGEYRSLTLDFVGVTGQIPEEIGMLTTLERLSVRSSGAGNPTLTGSLPDSIGELTNMQTIRLNDNEIGGTIPSSLGRMTNAQVLLFTGNSMGGQIPTELGQIQGGTLAFDGNELSGSIPTELFGLSELTTINFERNFLTGPIPSEIGNVGNLNLLDLSSNDMTGSLPTQIGLLTAVRGKLNR